MVDLMAICGTTVGPILNSFFANVIYAILGIVLFKLYLEIKRRKNTLRQILGIKIQEIQFLPPGRKYKNIYISYGLVPPSELSIPEYAIEEGDARSLYTLVSFLSDVYDRDAINVLNHEDIRSELENVDSLVTLSGPTYNKVTEYYLGRTGSPLGFFWENGSGGIRTELSDYEPEKWETQYDENEKITKCYGIVLRSKINLEGKSQTVIIIAGITSLSTYGGVKLLQRIYRDTDLQSTIIEEDLDSKSDWLCLYSVENWESSASWRKNKTPFKRIDININIEKIFTDSDFGEPYNYDISD